MSAPVLSGDLRSIPLADILLMLNTNHKSGTLRCSGPTTTKDIDYEKGAIVFARSTSPGDRLGAFLLTQQKITAVQLQQASPMVTRQDRLGKVLIKIGALTPADLYAAVKLQVTEIVYSLFHWKEGLFDFREGQPSSEKIALDVNVMNLIMEGARRLDEWSRVKEKIHNERVILAPVKSAEEARQVELSEFERTVLACVDGKRTVREIIERANHTDFETWQALHALLSAGFTRIQVLAFDVTEGADEPPPVVHAEGSELDRVIDRWGGAVSLLLARASAIGPGETARLRKKLREANFVRVDLLREMAIAPDGRIDRHALLANVADLPGEQRARALQGALDGLLQVLLKDLKGKVTTDDIMAGLGTGG